MNNIERFNLYTAYIFGELYKEFPVARMMIAKDVVERVGAVTGEQAAYEPKFVAYTLRWLEETGFIRAYGEGANRTFVLAPRAFEAMAATLPKALGGKEAEEQTVGSKLADVASGLKDEVGKETKKQIAAQLVGTVIGYAMRAFSGPA